MQPNTPDASPPPAPMPTLPNSQQLPSLEPDYNFLGEQPKKSFNIPLLGNTLRGRLAVCVIGLLILVILFVVIKGLLTTPPFNKPDLYLVTERQQEILHILSTDVTSNNEGQLSQGEQNFAATASLAIQTSQTQTLTFMADYKYKINSKVLSAVYSTSLDQAFTNALTANTFANYFQSAMETQLQDYQQELKAAYNSTHISGGRGLLRSEYAQTNLLLNEVEQPLS